MKFKVGKGWGRMKKMPEIFWKFMETEVSKAS